MIERYWNYLEMIGVSEQTLQLITDINGYSEKTMAQILYAHTGYNSFEQLDEYNGEYPPFEEVSE